MSFQQIGAYLDAYLDACVEAIFEIDWLTEITLITKALLLTAPMSVLFALLFTLKCLI